MAWVAVRRQSVQCGVEGGMEVVSLNCSLMIYIIVFVKLFLINVAFVQDIT